MAAEAEKLIAKRTALLARCQAAREQRRRREKTAAEDEQEAAKATRDEARSAADLAIETRKSGLRQKYAGLSDRPITLADMNILQGQVRGFARRQEEAVEQAGKMDTALVQADKKLKLANKTYTIEAQRTRKREEFAERSRKNFDRKSAFLEESDIEEELSNKISVSGNGRR